MFSWIFTHVGACRGRLFRGVGVTFWSGRGHFFVNFGMSWDVSGSGLGMFLEGFGMVLEKMSDEVGKSKFSKLTGSIFPKSGRFRIAFLTVQISKISKNRKFQFSRIFPYILI